MKSKKSSPHTDKIVGSMKLAASELNTSVPALQALRDGGCTGFNINGRVNLSEVRRYLAGRDGVKLEATAPGASLKDQKTSEEIRKLRIANDAKEKLVVLRSAVCAAIDAYAKLDDALLEAKLENEYPSSIAGLDVPGARVKGRQLRDSLRAERMKFASFFNV